MNIDLSIHAGTAIYSAIVLLILWYLCAHLWRDYRTQAFRQNLFELRAQLFEYAKEGNIEFSDPAYRVFRLHINALIRYAYHMSFATLIISLMFHKLKRSQASIPLQEQIASSTTLSPEQKSQLRLLYYRFLWMSIWQIGATSFFAWIAVAVVIVKYRLQALFAGEEEPVTPPKTMVRHVQYLESQAVETERERVCMASA